MGRFGPEKATLPSGPHPLCGYLKQTNKHLALQSSRSQNYYRCDRFFIIQIPHIIYLVQLLTPLPHQWAFLINAGFHLPVCDKHTQDNIELRAIKYPNRYSWEHADRTIVVDVQIPHMIYLVK